MRRGGGVQESNNAQKVIIFSESHMGSDYTHPHQIGDGPLHHEVVVLLHDELLRGVLERPLVPMVEEGGIPRLARLASPIEIDESHFKLARAEPPTRE